MSAAAVLLTDAALGETRIERDGNRDGKPDQIIIYDDQGQVLKVEIDADQDGFAERLQFYADGRPVRIERDLDLDRIRDCTDFMENGRRIRQERRRPDGGLVQIALFDAQEKLLTIKKDTTGDRYFDTVYRFEDGLLALSDRDTDANGRPNVRTWFKDQTAQKQQTDANEDGVMEEILFFDKKGQPEKRLKDPDKNGIYTHISFFENGEIKTVHKDLNADEKPDVVIEFKGGQSSTRKTDRNFDGRFDSVTRFVNQVPASQEKDTDLDDEFDFFAEFDSRGAYSRIREDLKKTGHIDRIRYFEAGQAVRVETDEDVNGVFERVTLLKGGRIIQTRQDKNQDGRMDTDLFFNTLGQKTQLVSDTDFDGYFETIQRYNDPRWSIVVSQDFNLDKKPETIAFYKNRLLRQRQMDESGDGRIDCIEYYRPDGRLERLEEYPHGSARLTWFYTTDPMPVRAEEDTDGNETVDIWYHYENGLLTRVEEDTNQDGTPDLWESYDSAQTLVRREKDLDFDGTPDLTDINETDTPSSLSARNGS